MEKTMSGHRDKDMLGPVTRALVGVDQNRLPLIAKIAGLLTQPDRGLWFDYLADIVNRGLVQGMKYPGTVAKTVESLFQATQAKLIKDCFPLGNLFSYRAATIDSALPDQPASEPGKVEAYVSGQDGMTLSEALQRHLGVESSEKAFQAMLKSYCVTVPVIEQLAECHNNSDESLLFGYYFGYRNNFLVLDKNERVTAVQIFKDKHGWQVYQYDLDSAKVDRFHRILLRIPS
jgi:hypothetical protein